MSDLDYGPVLDRLIEYSQKLGATAVDGGIGRSEGVEVSVHAGKLETIERDEAVGVSLRCLVGQRQAHVSGSDLSEAGLNALAERCVKMAKAAPEDDDDEEEVGAGVKDDALASDPISEDEVSEQV